MACKYFQKTNIFEKITIDKIIEWDDIMMFSQKVSSSNLMRSDIIIQDTDLTTFMKEFINCGFNEKG